MIKFRTFITFVIMVIAGTTGCTTVHIAGGSPSITQGIGFVVIQLGQSNEYPQIVTTKSIGLTATNHSATLGYLNEVSVWLPDLNACRVVIFTEKDDELANLKEAFARSEKVFVNICMVSKEGKSWFP